MQGDAPFESDRVVGRRDIWQAGRLGDNQDMQPGRLGNTGFSKPQLAGWPCGLPGQG
jgi:hypothetical protein